MSCVSGRFFPGSGSKSQILDPDPQHYFCLKRNYVDQRSYIWTFSMGKCLNMPKVWVQSWGSFPLALAAEIVPKKLNEMTHSKTWFINISNTCWSKQWVNATIFTLVWILLLYKNSSEKLQYLILKILERKDLKF